MIWAPDVLLVSPRGRPAPGDYGAWLDAGPGEACKSLALALTFIYIVIHGNYSEPVVGPVRTARVRATLRVRLEAHGILALSSATSRLVDEAQAIREHPLITFKDGPAGRRARLVGGPDVLGGHRRNPVGPRSGAYTGG